LRLQKWSAGSSPAGRAKFWFPGANNRARTSPITRNQERASLGIALQDILPSAGISADPSERTGALDAIAVLLEQGARAVGATDVEALLPEDDELPLR